MDCDFSPSSQGTDLDFHGFTASSQEGNAALRGELGVGMGVNMKAGISGMDGTYALPSQPCSQGGTQSASEMLSLPSSLTDGVGGLSLDTQKESQEGFLFRGRFEGGDGGAGGGGERSERSERSERY